MKKTHPSWIIAKANLFLAAGLLLAGPHTLLAQYLDSPRLSGEIEQLSIALGNSNEARGEKILAQILNQKDKQAASAAINALAEKWPQGITGWRPWSQKAVAQLGGLLTSDQPKELFAMAQIYSFIEDKREFESWLLKAAAAGSGPAQFSLAIRRRESNPGEAMSYLKRAADSGNALAQRALGGCYLHQAAKKLSSEEQRLLGVTGTGFQCEQENFNAVFEIYQAMPVGGGGFRSTYEKDLVIGKLLYFGIGTKRNYAEAHRLLNQAFENDRDDAGKSAARILSEMYRTGQGVRKDAKKASELWLHAMMPLPPVK